MYRYDEVSCGCLFLLWFSFLSVQMGETSARFTLLPVFGSFNMTGFTYETNFLTLFFFLCSPHSGANQQFGEPGVWPGHVKEWQRRRSRCCRWRRGGPLSRPKPHQSIACQARPQKACHRGGVPGTPVHQPHAQGRSCILSREWGVVVVVGRRLDIVALCAVPMSHSTPP